MYDYGNARIAARRVALLDTPAIEGMAAAGSASAMLSSLERQPGWEELLGPIRREATGPAAAAEGVIERYRSSELGALPGWYPDRAHALVEALVMDLDRERVVAVVRRRAADQEPGAIVPTIVPGALLDGDDLAELARQPSTAALARALCPAGILEKQDADALARTAEEAVPEEVEAALDRAWHRARMARAGGGGADARAVRELLADEEAERRAVQDAITGAAGGAALVERALRLARLRRLARVGRRDPVGIGSVAGYVAAVELQALRLRTALARAAAGWTAPMARSFLVESAD